LALEGGSFTISAAKKVDWFHEPDQTHKPSSVNHQEQNMEIAHIVNAMNNGELDADMVSELNVPQQSPVKINDWKMNYTAPNLIESCEVVASAGVVLGVGLLAFSRDGKTLFFGSYASTSDVAAHGTTGSTAEPSNSTALFNPKTNGNNVQGVVYGEVQLPNGTLVPFRQSQMFIL
jgi:hypothetical protein